MSDSARYRQLASRFGYLSKLACVFGQHIHLGVNDGDEAMYLCHALMPYFPQLIALSASSPLYQGVDTHFASSRFSAQNSFPQLRVPGTHLQLVRIQRLLRTAERRRRD
ncbi:TPA: glutamate-cysteine ligase family protein [Serratia marcescens]